MIRCLSMLRSLQSNKCVRSCVCVCVCNLVCGITWMHCNHEMNWISSINQTGRVQQVCTFTKRSQMVSSSSQLLSPEAPTAKSWTSHEHAPLWPAYLHCQVYVPITRTWISSTCSHTVEILFILLKSAKKGCSGGQQLRAFVLFPTCSLKTVNKKLIILLHLNKSANKRFKEVMSCPYIFPSTSRCPRDDVQEGVGQVTVTIKRVISTTKRDVAEISALKSGRRGEDRKRIISANELTFILKIWGEKKRHLCLMQQNACPALTWN